MGSSSETALKEDAMTILCPRCGGWTTSEVLADLAARYEGRRET